MKRILFIILLFAFFNSTVLGTPQIPDKIIYNGKTYKLWHSYPMKSFFEAHSDKNPHKEFTLSSTALWRGYVGHAVLMQRIVEKNITKVNGRVIQKVLYRVMDPAYGGSFYRINNNNIIDALNIFYIFK
jgi:hypothetical protein